MALTLPASPSEVIRAVNDKAEMPTSLTAEDISVAPIEGVSASNVQEALSTYVSACR